MINGDGTVPLKSAEAMTALKTYYVKNAQHAVMPSTSGVRELIAEILTATSTTDFDISPYSNLALTSDNCQISNGKIVSFHSPIELHIYDSSGNHTGPNIDGDIENNISGVVYEVIEDNKFAFLPDGIEYTIKGKATDAGTFDVRIQEIISGEVATTTIFADIPLTLTTQAQFTLGATLSTQIALDDNADGTFESNYGVSTTTAGILKSTVKALKVPAPPTNESISKPRSRSSMAQFTRVASVEQGISLSESEEVATSYPEIVLPDPIPVLESNSSPIQTTIPSELKETKETEEIHETPPPTVEPEEKYENTATVYKSFTYILKSFFRVMWEGLKSRLYLLK